MLLPRSISVREYQVLAITCNIFIKLVRTYEFNWFFQKFLVRTSFCPLGPEANYFFARPHGMSNPAVSDTVQLTIIPNFTRNVVWISKQVSRVGNHSPWKVMILRESIVQTKILLPKYSLTIRSSIHICVGGLVSFSTVLSRIPIVRLGYVSPAPRDSGPQFSGAVVLQRYVNSFGALYSLLCAMSVTRRALWASHSFSIRARERAICFRARKLKSLLLFCFYFLESIGVIPRPDSPRGRLWTEMTRVLASIGLLSPCTVSLASQTPTW